MQAKRAQLDAMKVSHLEALRNLLLRPVLILSPSPTSWSRNRVAMFENAATPKNIMNAINMLNTL